MPQILLENLSITIFNDKNENEYYSPNYYDKI